MPILENTRLRPVNSRVTGNSMDFENMTAVELEAANEEIWQDSHPFCEACHERGCAHGCCTSLDGLVMLTDGTTWHPFCLVKEQVEEAKFGNAEYRVGPR